MVKPYLIHITRGPSLSNGKLYGNIFTLEITPTPRSVVTGPVVVQTVVQSSLVIVVAVVTGGHALDRFIGVTSLVSQVPGQQGLCSGRHAGLHNPVQKAGQLRDEILLDRETG